MNVIFVTREGYALSGARVRCYNFARQLCRHGIDARVFSFPEQLDAKFGEQESQMSLFDKAALNLRAFQILIKEPKETIFVLQRVNYHAMAPLLAALFKRNKVIFDCDDWNIRENPVYHFGFYPSSKMEYVTRQVAKHAKTCIAASGFLKNYLRSFNPSVHYLPTGVDTSLFRPQHKNDPSKVTFSWIGTAYHPEMGENIRFLLDCFSAVADQYGHAMLSLAGKGSYFDAVRREIDGHKHKDRIEVRSWIPPDKMPEYLSTVDVGLLPLIQDTKFNKAKSPTKLFEYMSMTKPVIASDIGEAKSIIREKETGLLAKGRNEFIAGMCFLIENPDLRQSIGKKAREDAESHYSLEFLGKKMAEIVNGL
jgi:glycosyltransferase involved in cell wall biosynthesis